ncbi:DUF4236 domain-containing protein [Cyanobium sp. WKJ7-Wakatipu]|nr:DUF4236 domain-containing protein [Cyanobium sp. WKJ7-Wakatipu]
MGFRFRRGLRFGPFRFNITGKGLSSFSIGGRGATVNIPINWEGPARATASLPGTGLSWSEPIGRTSTGERRQAQRGAAGQPTTEQIVAAVQEAFVGTDGVGQALWHHPGLVALLMDRPDTPRAVLEQCQLVLSADRIELHIRRGRGPADTMARAKQVLEAAKQVLAYAVTIGLVKEG